MSMSSVPCSSSIRFLYWSFSPIGVDTLLPVAVDCLLPHHGGASELHRACPCSFKDTHPQRVVRSDETREPRIWSLNESRNDTKFVGVKFTAPDYDTVVVRSRENGDICRSSRSGARPVLPENRCSDSSTFAHSSPVSISVHRRVMNRY